MVIAGAILRNVHAGNTGGDDGDDDDDDDDDDDNNDTDIRGCTQKFPDWPPGARTANGAALCH
jgi:hypothetical protein